MAPRFLLALVSFLAVLAPSSTHADPWLRSSEDALEEPFADGDIDQEDVAIPRLAFRGGSADVHGQSWVSLQGFTSQLMSGQSDIGAMVVVGLALDRIFLGKVHQIADVPPSASPAPLDTPSPPARNSRRALVAPGLARACVAAALRASGLGTDDAAIDQLAARARASAWLPETRMRAMRLLDDAAHATTLATTDGTNYYDAVGSNLVLELRLTWRLDRLLYAGDEPTLERARIERQQARAHLATRTLEVLFGWQRALIDAQSLPSGSREELDAWLRASEAEATLDVLTDGWFSRSARDGAAPPTTP